MDTSIASVVFLKNSIISFGQTVILVIVRMTSRKVIARMLLRLPANFFPSYRIVVSPIVIGNNVKLRYVEQQEWLDTSSDDSMENYCRCCGFGQRRPYSDQHSDIFYRGDEENNEETFIMDISMAAECSTPNPGYDKVDLDEEPHAFIPIPPPLPPPTRDRAAANDASSAKVVPTPPKLPDLNPLGPNENRAPTPPLRRITVQELKSVKLRPSKLFTKTPKTPEVNDMLEVLRKRYSVMRFSFGSEGESVQLVSF